jgi:chromosome segregation ATPase
MPRHAKITYLLVKEIADALYADTQLIPIIESVKEKLRELGYGKGGSNSTIAGFLRQWRREQGLLPEAEPAERLSDPITEAVRHIQATLTEETNARLAEVQADAQSKIEAAQAAEHIAQQNRDLAQRQIAELRDALSDAHTQLSATREQLAAEHSARDHAERQAQALAEQIKKREEEGIRNAAQARIEIATERERTDRVRQEMNDRLAEMQQAVERIKAEHADKTYQWMKTEGRLTAVIESEKDKLAIAQGKLQELQTEIGAQAETIKGLHQLLSDRDSTITGLREQAARQTAMIEAAHQRAQQLEGERRLDQARMTDLEQMIRKGQDIIALLQQGNTRIE